MSFFHNFVFQIRARRTPRLMDAKTKKMLKNNNQRDARLVHFLAQRKFPSFTQLKYIGKTLSGRERLTIKLFFIGILLAAAFIGANTYFNFTVPVPAVGGTYTEGLIGAPQLINPIYATSNDVDMDLVHLLFDGLVQFDQDKGLMPALATEWSISEDQKTYTFTIRDNVKWHDGEPFTVDDVVFTFERIKDRATRSPLYFNFKDVTVEPVADNDKQVRFILKEPFAPFLENLTTGILPAHRWRSVPTSSMTLSDYNIKPIGTGPFAFDSLVKDSATGLLRSYTVKRNPDYFFHPAYIEHYQFKFYPTMDEAINGLNNKNVNGLSYLPKDKIDQLVNERALNFHALNLPQYSALFINKSKNAILKDLKIRKIIAHAINKDAIIADILNAEAQKIDGPILPGQIGYSDTFTKYSFDPDEAKKQLEDAGWKLADYVVKTTTPTATTPTTPPASATSAATPSPEASAPLAEEATPAYPFQVRKKGSDYLEFTITTVDQPEMASIAEAIQVDLQQVGIKANVKLVAADLMQTSVIKTRDYEILLYGEIVGLDPDPYPFWHSSQVNAPGLNLAMFANKEADTLLEDARKTTDNKLRGEKYQKFQEILATEIPAIFLFNPTYSYPQAKTVQGFATHTIIVPADRFAQVTDWYVETKRSFK